MRLDMSKSWMESSFAVARSMLRYNSQRWRCSTWFQYAIVSGANENCTVYSQLSVFILLSDILALFTQDEISLFHYHTYLPMQYSAFHLHHVGLISAPAMYEAISNKTKQMLLHLKRVKSEHCKFNHLKFISKNRTSLNRIHSYNYYLVNHWILFATNVLNSKILSSVQFSLLSIYQNKRIHADAIWSYSNCSVNLLGQIHQIHNMIYAI